MQLKISLLTIISTLFLIYPLSAQRGHEIQFQTGYLRNWGVIFWDYHESETRRHNYEFDPVFDADLLSLSWHYPLNAYFDLGLSVTKSYDSSFELLQAESFLFDPDVGNGPQTGAHFAGLTDLEAKYLALGSIIRINHLIRSNKYKYYLIFNPTYQLVEVLLSDADGFETEDTGLKQAIISDFVGKETTFSMAAGIGVSYPLKSGINIKILEIYNRYIFSSTSSHIFSTSHSLELRTGISYQFYRRK